MDTQHIRCFMAVAKHMNFTRAAKDLWLTPSAVGYQIASLERELDFKLFERMPNSVRFTEAGEFFHTGLQTVLSSYDALVSEGQRLASGKAETLSIGFLGGLAQRFLVPVVERFRAKYPSINLQLHQFEMAQLAQALMKGEVGVAMTLDEGLPAQGHLKAIPFFTEQIVVLMHPDHPLAGRTSLTWVDLKDVACLDLARPKDSLVGNPFELRCAKHGFRPNITARLPDLDSLFLAVASGLGVVAFPRYRVEPVLGPRLTFVPLAGEDSTTCCVFAWKPGEADSPIEKFIGSLEPGLETRLTASAQESSQA